MRSPLLRWKTRAAIFSRLLRLRFLYLVSWVSLALSLPLSGVVGQWFGWIGLGLGVCLFVADTRRLIAKVNSLSVDATSHPECDDLTLFSGPNATATTLRLSVTNTPWQIEGLHPNAEERYKIIKDRAITGSDLTDDLKVRICNDPDELQTIHVQPTRYFNGLLTNEFVGFRIMRDGLVTYDPVHEIWKNGTLRNLTDSPASNHLGVILLIQTIDERFLIQQGSRRANVGSRKANPSVSGSVDWADLSAETKTLDKLAQRAILREFCEETGLDPQEWLGEAVPQQLAFGRINARGGKPELAYLITSKMRAAEWKTALTYPPAPETQTFHCVPGKNSVEIQRAIKDDLHLTPSYSLLFALRALKNLTD